MNTLDFILLQRAQFISDKTHGFFGIDNFLLSKIFFALSVMFLLSGASFCMANNYMDIMRGICTLLGLGIIAAFFTTADRGSLLDSGHIEGVPMPYSYKIITLEWLRPYALGLIGISCVVFMYVCLFEKPERYIADVPLQVLVRGFDAISIMLVTVGIYFLSCEKKKRKKRRRKDYEVFAH
jgi:hypothetical protein